MNVDVHIIKGHLIKYELKYRYYQFFELHCIKGIWLFPHAWENDSVNELIVMTHITYVLRCKFLQENLLDCVPGTNDG